MPPGHFHRARRASATTRQGCYIATAAYGSYDAPEVRVRRRFRDDRLRKSPVGRALVSMDYAVSQPVADRLRGARRTNAALRRILDGVVAHLSV
ncbi:CFI-box-CTERM domain-containing protein [Demequina sp. NBRC 110057]|uniref:CFI-box-CTERM domain-containing protein n=1 Tax=Demequina sp. NBRC 110057 TaxID=1570346 RepID=UPI0035CD2CF2